MDTPNCNGWEWLLKCLTRCLNMIVCLGTQSLQEIHTIATVFFAVGTKTAAICRILQRFLRLPLYIRSIVAFFGTAAIGIVFCGVL